MVELLEVADNKLLDAKYWRIVVGGSWLGTATYMADRHLGVRMYEDAIIAPFTLKAVAAAVEELERKLNIPASLPLFPPQPGEIGN